MKKHRPAAEMTTAQSECRQQMFVTQQHTYVHITQQRLCYICRA